MTNPRRRRRRAWQALLFGLAGFAFFQAALAFLMDTTRPDLFDPEFGCRLRLLKDRLRESPGRPLVVALGSSRTQMGLCPEEVPAVAADGGPALVFNFGQAGCGPLQELICLRRLLAAGVRPNYLLIEVLPAALHADADGAEIVHTERLGHGDLAVLAPYCREPDKLYRKWASNRLAPWFSARFCLMSRWLPGWLPWQARQDYMWNTIDRFGWLAFPHETIPPSERAKALQNGHDQYGPNLATFRVSPLPDRALREVLELCRREGIRTALYLMPEGTTFRSWYPPAARSALDGYLAGLSAEYGVPLFDARDWLVDADFADDHHMLPAGARKFSRRFGREVVGPFVTGR